MKPSPQQNSGHFRTTDKTRALKVYDAHKEASKLPCKAPLVHCPILPPDRQTALPFRPVHVCEPHNVILTQVCAGLNFNIYQWCNTGGFQAALCAYRHAGWKVFCKQPHHAAVGHLYRDAYNNPGLARWWRICNERYTPGLTIMPLA